MWWIIFFHHIHRFHRISYIDLPQMSMRWIFVRNAVKCGEIFNFTAFTAITAFLTKIYRIHRISYKNLLKNLDPGLVAQSLIFGIESVRFTCEAQQILQYRAIKHRNRLFSSLSVAKTSNYDEHILLYDHLRIFFPWEHKNSWGLRLFLFYEE